MLPNRVKMHIIYEHSIMEELIDWSRDEHDNYNLPGCHPGYWRYHDHKAGCEWDAYRRYEQCISESGADKLGTCDCGRPATRPRLLGRWHKE